MVVLDLFLTLLVGSAWIWLVIRLDTHRKEKKSQAVLLKFFLAGFLSLIPTAILYFLSYAFWGSFLEQGWLFAFIEELFITGPVEEFSKLIVFLLVSRKMKSIKEPMDGVLQAAAVALAFATAENFLYTQRAGLWILPWRAVLSTSGHLLYASIWGYVYGAIVYESAGEKLRSEYRAIFAAVLPSAILHGLFNFMLDLGRLEAALLIDLCALIVGVMIYRFLRERSPYNPMHRQNPKQAVTELTSALRHNPESPLLNQRLALLYVYYRDFVKALKHARICLKRRPTNPYFICVEAVVRILSGEVDRGAELMEDAYPRLSKEARKALHRNVRRVISAGGQKLHLPYAFGPEHAVACRFFEKVAGLPDAASLPSYRRVQLNRRRYLAKVG
jgi:RsiW-degrading membrane proteinase PrsW (M82 family)